MTPEEIQKLRKRIGLSQGQFARLFEVSRQTVNNWEQGHTRPGEAHRKIMARVTENLQQREQRERLKNLITATGMLGIGVLIDWFSGDGT